MVLSVLYKIFSSQFLISNCFVLETENWKLIISKRPSFAKKLRSDVKYGLRIASIGAGTFRLRLEAMANAVGDRLVVGLQVFLPAGEAGIKTTGVRIPLIHS